MTPLTHDERSAIQATALALANLRQQQADYFAHLAAMLGLDALPNQATQRALLLFVFWHADPKRLIQDLEKLQPPHPGITDEHLTGDLPPGQLPE